MMIVLAMFLACGGGDPVKAEEPTAPPAPPAAATVSVGPEVLEALKTADAADGKEDKVATKCSGCALAMDGDAAHTVTVDGYALHLCSAMCKENFSKDIEGNLKQLLN